MKRFCLLIFCCLMFSPRWGVAGKVSPQRVISLKPNITDILYAMGMGDALIGVTRHCDTGASQIKPAIVADYMHISIEKIIALAPDLVIGSEENSSRRSIEALSRLGINVKLFPFTTLKESLRSIREIGALVEFPKKGETLAQEMEEKLTELKKRWGGKKPPLSTLVVWGVRPLVVAGKGTYMDELLEYIGVRNAVESSQIKYPRISLEELIRMNPEAIIDLSMGSEAPENEMLPLRPWNSIGVLLKAVAHHRVVRMEPSAFRAGPALPDALEALAIKTHKTQP